MRCPRCQVDNPEDTKFCGQRAASLTAATEPRFAPPGAYTPKPLAEQILTSRAALEASASK